MTPAQFDAICTLISMRDSPSREVARLHLVEGVPVPEAAQRVGIGKVGGYKAVQRVRAGFELARVAVGLLPRR